MPPKTKMVRKQKPPSQMRLLAKKLYAARTRSAAEDILTKMDSLSKRLSPPLGDEYIEETLLGMHDRDNDDWGVPRSERTTMADCRKLAKRYM